MHMYDACNNHTSHVIAYTCIISVDLHVYVQYIHVYYMCRSICVIYVADTCETHPFYICNQHIICI